jgi:hypothetical protein
LLLAAYGPTLPYLLFFLFFFARFIAATPEAFLGFDKLAKADLFAFFPSIIFHLSTTTIYKRSS